ncbi:MAG: hypothetical protein DRQ41_05925 [Gammaproteobacteria bacterium]|nr:MAG: hypothetical protein DRQ41_05925 [Gammaproteobacteria bacterium]
MLDFNYYNIFQNILYIKWRSHSIYEAQREQFLNNYRVIRFHHQVDLKTLFNSILRAKMGTITKLYNYVYPETSKSSVTELNFS